MGGNCLHITYEPRLAIARIDRPEKKNAFSLALIEELHEAAREFRRRTDISAVILTGTKDYFSAGMDIGDPAFHGLPEAPLAEQRRLMAYAPEMCRAWEGLEPVTIAAIEGFCLGGGLSLACSLDFRVMAESSYIRAPEIEYGMNMSWGTLPRLVPLIGPARTKQLIILAEPVGAREAFEWGFAQKVCTDGTALEEARHLAEKVVSRSHVPATMTKQTVNAITTAIDKSVSHMDRDQFLLSILNPDSLRSISGFVDRKKSPAKDE